MLSPPPGLTQSATSFIASCCQGIHQTPFSRLIRSRRRQALLCVTRPLAFCRKSLTHALPVLGREDIGGGPNGASRHQANLPVSVYFDLERLQNLTDRPHRRTDGQTGSPRIAPLVGARRGAVPRGTCCSLRTEVRRQTTKTCVSCIALFTMLNIRSCDRTAKHIQQMSLPIRSLSCGCRSGAHQRIWWVEEELNLRPHAYQACALTT